MSNEQDQHRIDLETGFQTIDSDPVVAATISRELLEATDAIWRQFLNRREKFVANRKNPATAHHPRT